jgi:Ca2+-binding EF-hand superfamily protein
MLSDLQKRKHTHQFHVMDEDGNGHLEWGDYERIASKIAGIRGYAAGSPEFAALVGQYRFAWDQSAPFQDETGFSLDRWLEYQVALLNSPDVYDVIVRDTAEMIFDTFDLDGDKRVSPEEWRGFFRCYGIDEKHTDTCFPKFDRNGDGYVTRDELIALVREFFLSSDPDAPGNLLFGPLG